MFKLPNLLCILARISSFCFQSSDVVQRSGSISLEASDSDEDQMSGASSRPCTPQTFIPVDFSEPASSLSCLDSSAAHHRIAVKSRACAKRKPASREILQPKRRDLRERVLLKDTEDKLRASRTSKGEEENRDNVLGEDEIIGDQQNSPESLSILTQNQRELPASSHSQRSSTATSASGEASEDDERVPDKDHVAGCGILETSWETSVTLELNTDDFLLDAGCEVVSDEQGSLLEEVLSSLKGPLVSGLVLDSDATAEQMEVEDTCGKDVLGDQESATEHLDSTDPSVILEDRVPVEDTLFESVTFLREAEIFEQEEEVPEEQELAEDVPFEEDLHVFVGGIEMEVYKVEEDQHDGKDLTEEIAEDSEIINCAGEDVVMEQEDEDTKTEESLEEEEDQESDKDAEEEPDQEEEMLVGDDKECKDMNEEEAEDDETISQESSPLEDEEQEIELDTSIIIESFHEIGESVEGDTSGSTEVVNPPEDLIAQECTEQPSFVVMTSLELSFPKKTSPQETEDVPEILQEDNDEQHDSLEKGEDQPTESLQIDEEHSEDVLHEDVLTHQTSTSESEAANESLQEISQCAADEDPVFNKSPSRDQSSVSITAEQPAGQGETLQSSPLSPFQKEICQADEDATPENPFGVRLRKTPVLHRYASEGDSPSPGTEPVETQKPPFLEQLPRKPVLTKKPDQGADGVVKAKKNSDPVGKESVEISQSPSWISLARQKQKIFKENSLDESLSETKISAQDEFNKKVLLDDPPGPVGKDQLKPVASSVKVSCSLEISKPVLEKRSISHSVPAPLTQDEPPWLALAKKKAKAWSEMPQIVQ